jgi:uncharacterized membrane protein
MTTTQKNPSKIFTLVGAGLGLALFLAIGLLPSILYGGYAGVVLAGGLFGTPVASTLLTRALIVIIMVLAVVLSLGLFSAAGAVAGSVVAALTRSARKVEGDEPDAVEPKA